MATHYNLVFRGTVHKDQHPAVVRGRLQKLLKASDAQIDVMFSGKAVTIKKAADQHTAERYLDAFVKAGAKLELVEAAAPVATPVSTPASAAGQAEAAAASEQTDAQAQQAGTSGLPPQPGSTSGADFQLAEAGANLLPRSAQPDVPKANVSTDHLSLASPGTNLGEINTSAAVVPPVVDTSYLQLDQPGVRLGVPAPEPTDVELLLDFDFELGDVGEALVESRPVAEPEPPDVSHLQLERLPVEILEPAEPA